MAYIYKVDVNEDPNNPELYGQIYCYKILQRKFVETKKDSYFSCSYHNGDKICWKKLMLDEGVPFGKSYAFWLDEKDHERAIEIFHKEFKARHDARRNRIKFEAKRLIWEGMYISNLDKKSIIVM